MPKWKKGAKEFKVAVHHNDKSGYYTTTVPKPVIDHLGGGNSVESIVYKIRGKRTEVASASDEDSST